MTDHETIVDLIDADEAVAPEPNWRREPESYEAALAERSDLIGEVASIMLDLDDDGRAARFASEADYLSWRHRANRAKRFMERRIGFLKGWLATNQAPPRPPRTTPLVLPGPTVRQSPTHFVNAFKRTVGLMEAVILALDAYVNGGVDGEWEEAVAHLNRLRANNPEMFASWDDAADHDATPPAAD